MTIAIHHNPGTFSDYWIKYCIDKKIDFKIVNCYGNDIIKEIQKCSALMWHFSNYNYRDMLIARNVLYSANKMGLKTFPNFDTVWHFDDKVSQKYLLEALGAPIVETFVFLNKGEAINWIESTNFPIVFKLRGGSGSRNVYLVRSKRYAKKLVSKAFSNGFETYNKWRSFSESLRKYCEGKLKIRSVLVSIYFLFFTYEYSKYHGKEMGYVYFQKFIPNNTFDIRVVVVGDKAFAIKRMNRSKDFRASGSGNIIYESSQIDERCIKISFEVNEKLQSQSIAFDFLFDENNDPKIVEISYGYVPKGYEPCPGYWDKNLRWNQQVINPYGWMIEDLIKV